MVALGHSSKILWCASRWKDAEIVKGGHGESHTRWSAEEEFVSSP